MPKLGPWEIILILGLVLLVFGPGRLGLLRNAFRKAVRSFNQAAKGDNGD